MANWTDEQLVERTSDITAALFGCGQIALQRGDTEWLDRHRWFSDACDAPVRRSARRAARRVILGEFTSTGAAPSVGAT